MLNIPSALTLVSPDTGNLAFKLFSFDTNCFDELQRNNFYSLIWLTGGKGKLQADFAEYDLEAGILLAFAPYQPFLLLPDSPVSGVVLQFHPDFFCIHKHQQEVACHGVLFNNIYKPPFICVDEASATTFVMVLEQLMAEMQNPALAQYELLVSYLKIFLITATRLKNSQQQPEAGEETIAKSQPFILQKLKDHIELHYKTKHTAAKYADMLNISPKALAKITKAHFNKTLTNLIAERIVIEAKRELYLTNKPVKVIAYDLGYDDESYFSRFFKTNAHVSPQMYRDTVGFNKMQMA